MNRLKKYFIGDILSKTQDVFEQAKVIVLYRFALVFCVVFCLPIITDLALGYNKAIIIHSIALVILFSFPIIFRKIKQVNYSINLFMIVSSVISFIIYMIIKPDDPNPIGISWTVFFLVLSAILQTGKMRIVFCCLIHWLPFVYVVVNQQLKGALTWELIVERKAENPPILLIFIPVSLTLYAVWINTNVLETARKTITQQKQLIAEKNKDMVDSIVYAKRIQDSLLPTKKYIEKSINRLKKQS